jgi:hypothetical protein
MAVAVLIVSPGIWLFRLDAPRRSGKISRERRQSGPRPH